MSVDAAATNVGYVYAIESAAFPGFVKIGRTNNIKRRLEAINFSMPINQYELITYFPTHNAVAEERNAHEFFKSFRFEREYFKIGGEDRQQIFNYFLKGQNAFVLNDELSISQHSSANKKRGLQRAATSLWATCLKTISSTLSGTLHCGTLH